MRCHRLGIFVGRSPSCRAPTNRSDEYLRTSHDNPTRHNHNDNHHKFDNDIDIDDHHKFDQHHTACADDHAGAAAEP